MNNKMINRQKFKEFQLFEFKLKLGCLLDLFWEICIN